MRKTAADFSTTFAIFVFYVFVAALTTVSGTKCFKDESVGDRDGNVYYCNDGTNTECCTEDGEFSCCEPTEKKTLREQLILWGCVAGVGLVVSLCCCYFWKESLCCGSDVPLSQRCCCCRRKASEDKKSLTPEPQPSVSRVPRGFSASPWKPRDRDPFSAGTDADSPIPPFRYKAPTLGKY